MQVANEDLCKELYELSGWKGVNAFYASDSWIGFVRQEGYNPQIGMLETVTPDNCIPAYDLGYLIRKLPKFYEDAEFWLTNDGLSWTAGYATDKYADGNFHFLTAETADTPEDCTTKLAIELFKQGILK